MPLKRTPSPSPESGSPACSGPTAALLDWFAASSRDLPWRTNYDPYQVFVSEIMLQQTQMDRVVPFFLRFMDRFPDLASLARADEEEVLKAWEGLGYYSRARNLLAAARVMQQRHAGRVPRDPADIAALPGAGPYTAGAVASVAYNHPATAVDANVERVLARLMDLDTPVKSREGRARIRDAAQALLPRDRARDFNQALMELGALVCQPRQPGCPACPLAPWCASLAAGTVDRRPVATPRPETIPILMVTGVLAHEGRLYIQKRRPDDVWPGLWEFPGGVIEKGESAREALLREYREETDTAVEPLDPITTVRYSYTRYRVTMHAFYCRFAPGQPPRPALHEATAGAFVHPQELSGYAFPAGHRRLIAFMLGDPRLAGLTAPPGFPESARSD